LTHTSRIDESLSGKCELELDVGVPYDNHIGVDSCYLFCPNVGLRAKIAVQGIGRRRVHEEVAHAVEHPNGLAGQRAEIRCFLGRELLPAQSKRRSGQPLELGPAPRGYAVRERAVVISLESQCGILSDPAHHRAWIGAIPDQVSKTDHRVVGGRGDRLERGQVAVDVGQD
jgi:hypothetical protein